MDLATRSAKSRSSTDEDPLFGYLLSGTAPYLEAVGVRIGPLFPSGEQRASTMAGVCGAPQHGTFTCQNEDYFGGLIRAIVYQPRSSISVVLDELSINAYKANANISALRRKVSGFAKLSANWDGEGAAPVSGETIKTSLQVIEHIAIVLERKNTSSLPSVRAFPDGSVFIKWICGNKELAMTIEGRNLEVQHWEPLDAFQSQGLWEISVDATPEHVEWVLT